MSTASDSFEDEYEEYDEFDDDDGDRGLSGLVVLLMGVVMFAAFASIVFIAYQTGIRTGRTGADGAIPYVAAEPEPVKIANQTDGSGKAADREVYDQLNGEDSEPVEILAAGPEEPVDRDSEDAIGALAAAAQGSDEEDAAEDQLASIVAEDAAMLDQEEPAAEAPPPTVTKPTPVNVQSAVAGVDPLSGGYVVQVAAFRSREDADKFWSRLETRLDDYLDGKGKDVERADLGERGIYYRLRIGPFASVDEARTYCAGLKDRKQDCMAKAK